jgi:hypothetical protein
MGGTTLGPVQHRPVTQTPAQPTQQTPQATAQPAEQPAAPLSPMSAATLANLQGVSSADIPPRVPFVGPAPNPARSAAVEQVTAAHAAYSSARAEVNRLNGHLEQALRVETALQDPAAAERFRSNFLSTHAAAYERERTTARQLADTLRAAEPHLRADGDLNQRMDAPASRDRTFAVQALETLAQSSEFAQAAQLAGQFAQGTPPLLSQQFAQGIGERAAVTGIHQDLATGHSRLDAISRASTLLSGAGLVSRTPALSALGNALSVGENLQAFMRTGDPASVSAAGFGVLGAGAATATMVGAGGPLTVGIAAVGAGGKFMSEQIANRNDYLRSTEAALQQTFGVSRAELDRAVDETYQQAIQDFANSSPEAQSAYRMGGGAWLDLAMRNAEVINGLQQRLLTERLAARP